MKSKYFLILLLISFNLGFTSTFTTLLPPSASISGGATVCLNAASPVVTFTGSGGTAPYTFTYKINGGVDVPIVTTTGNSVTVNAPTSVAGTFTYTLVSVKDSTNTTTNETGTVVIKIIAPFTVSAAANILVCKGNSINLTSSVSGNGTNPVSYSWTGPNGFTSNQQSPTIVSSTVLMSGPYTVTAKIGSCEVQDVVNVTVFEPTISSSQLQNYNNSQWIVQCTEPGEPNGLIFISNGISSNLQSHVISYTINWGDLTTPLFTTSNPGWSTNHSYNVGLYTLTISINTDLGCVITKSYNVFVGNQPASPGIQLPENAQGCTPFTLVFPITGVSQNVPGTTYSITFSDNLNAPLNYTQYDIPTSITRTFATTSCGSTFVNGSNTENNAFGVSIRAINPCGSSSSSSGPIRTSSKPTAIFTLPLIGCLNQTISTNNISVSGSIVSTTQCSANDKKYWEISPSNGWVLTSGTLGNDGGFPNQFAGWNDGSLNLGIKFNVAGTYTIKLTIRNGCAQSSTDIKTICIEPPLTPLFTLNNTTGCAPLAVTATNTTNLTNQCEPPTYDWQVSYASGYCGTSTTPIPNQTTTNASFNFIQPGTYTITLTTTNSCGTATSTQTVIVKKPPTVSIATLPASFCGSASISPVGTVNACAPTSSILTYAWSFPGGNPSSAATLNPSTINYTSPGNYTVSLVVSNECGVSTQATQSFVVNITPTVTNTVLSQTVCSGQLTTPITLTTTPASGTTLSWSATATAGISGFTPSGTSSTIPSQTITTTNANSGTITYVITPTFGNCIGAAVSYVVTVNPAPSILSNPASSVVCLNGVATPLTVSISSSSVVPTYQWYNNVSNATSGGTLITGATDATYVPPTNTVGKIYYYCVITFSSGGCAILTSNTASVDVMPLPTITAQPLASQNLCVGGSIPTALTVAYSGGIGTPTYQWYSNTTNSNSGGTLIGGATAASYSPSVFTTAGNYYYYVTISLSGSGCSAISSAVAEVLVVPDPTITAQPLISQTLCVGAIPTILVVSATGGNGNFTYQWFSNTSNNTTTGTIILGATTASYTPPSNAIGIKYYYCVVSQSTIGCSVTSATAAVIINQSPSVTTQPLPSTVCIGGTPNTLSFAVINGAGTATYQWYSNSINNNTSGAVIVGATTATFVPPATAEGITYYYCLITFSGITGACATIATNTAEVIVIPSAIITTQPLISQNLCVGGSIPTALTVAYAGGIGTPTYQWYSNTTNSNSAGSLINGAISASYSPSAFNTAGTYYYYVTISLSGNGCSPISSAIAEVIVVPDPTITTQPLASQTLCIGATPTNLVVSATGGNGAFSYHWFSNSSNNITAGTPIAGATNSTYVPPTTAVGTLYYYCVISQSTIGCGVTSATAAVIINQSPSVTTQPIPSTVCIGGIPNTLSFTVINGAGTATYQWYSNSIDNITSGTIIPGATTATFIPPATVEGITYYYCLITFSGITGACATIATNTAEVTVIPSAIITAQPLASQNLCVGGSIQNALTVSFSGGIGTATYQWYSNTTNSNSGGSLINGATSASYSPSVFNTAGTYYYYVAISLSGSGCSAISSAVAEVIVVPDPTITAQPLATQTLCVGATPTILAVSATGGNGTFTYQWFSNTSNNITAGTPINGATNSTYVPPTTAVGTLYYYCVISQSTIGCGVTSATAAVIINQSPSVTTQPLPSTVCIGGIPNTLSFTVINGAGTATYQWYSNSINNTTSGTIIPGATTATFIPPATVEGITYYYCLITFSGITGACATIATNTAEVTVIPSAIITAQPLASQNLCVGGSISTPLTASYVGGIGTATYQWYSNTTNSNSGGSLINGATSSNYTPSVFTTAGNYHFYATVSLSGSGCGIITSNVATIIVVNDPLVNVQPLPSQTICQNSVPTTLSVTPSGGIGTSYFYQWYSSTTNTSSGGTLIFGASTNTYSPLTTIVGTLYYYCIVNQVNSSGCSVISATAEVIVNPAPQIDIQPQSNVWCIDQTPLSLTTTYTNGTGTPLYQWYSNAINSTSGATLIVGATAASYTPSTISDGETYYYCVITFPSISGGCEIITSDTALITVNLNPIIASVTATICSNNSFLIAPITGDGNIVPGGTTYTWSQPVINPVGAVTGVSAQLIPQTEISQTLLNNTTNIATVTYTVTPTSGICVGAPFTVSITVNPAINPNIIISNNSCFGVNNASISTNITGGISPYIINWDGPNGFTSSATTISNIEPGTYTITIDDVGNCPYTNSYTITQPDAIVITTISQNNSSCFQSNDANIDISVSGGTGSYAYTWTKDGIAHAITEDISNLSPGNYTISVTDENNCGPTVATFTVTEPPLLVVSLLNQTNVKCFGDATGEITVAVSGGTVINDYTFLWTGPNGFTSNNQNLNLLFAGTYSLKVTDDNNCQKTLEVTITQSTPIIITYTTTPITCYGANNASLTATVSGGITPYQFTWSNLATSLNQNNLSAGNYTLTVTDNLGCIKIVTINIPEAQVFMVNPIVKNISCYGANDGSINLNLVGGIAPVALSWSDGSTAGLIRNNLTPGTYTATISDGTPCYIVRTFTIIQPQPLVLSANLSNPTDCDTADSGAINLIVSGGNPPFTYIWSNGNTTEDLTNLVAGNYAVTVTDSKGCVVSGQYSLVRPAPIVIVVTTQTDFNCATHEVTQNFVAQASGGIPPFQYNWSSGNTSGSNNQVMNTDTNGTVVLTVEDSLGCTALYTVNVTNPEIGYSSFESSSLGYVSYGIYSILDPIQFTSILTGDYESVYWDFGDGTFSSELNPIHTYLIPKDYVVTQTVTYPFGCVYTFTVTLTVEKGYLIVVPTAFTPNNDNINDTFRPVTKRLKNIVLDTYDTWGSIVYSEKGDVLVGWDGTINGFNAENGNYYSKVTAETFYGTIIHENQTFVLIK